MVDLSVVVVEIDNLLALAFVASLLGILLFLGFF